MDENNQPLKKSKFPTLILFGVASFLAIVALLIYSEMERSDIREMQQHYHTKIDTIKSYLNEGNCTQAAYEYVEAKEMRDEIVMRGLYYSIESFAKQAHEIEIAECFAERNEFENAVGMLHIEKSNDPDYLIRASAIYNNSGDTQKGEEAKSKAEQFDH
jgi:hypothetical protein